MATNPNGLVCSAPNTVCRNRAIRIGVNGQNYQSLHCQFHACKRIEDGHACRVATLPRAEVCSSHVRCTGLLSGLRCTQNIKDDNPGLYKFCSQLHGCLTNDCKEERIRLNGQDLNYCNKHRCAYEECNQPRQNGDYCEKHKCQDAHCSSSVSGAGGLTPGDPRRFCERHRRCKAANCSQYCHLRDSGNLNPFCGLHYCEATAGAGECQEQRGEGTCCPAHSCVEQGCFKPRAAAPAHFCKDHKCKKCQQRNAGGKFCPLHRCVFEGCEEEAEVGVYCARHQRCTVPGCERRRHVDNGTVLPSCEHHHAGVCRGADGRTPCTRRVEAETAYCSHHLCQIRECLEAKLLPSRYCGSHKCVLPDCHRLRKGVTWVHNQPFGGMYASTYCETHSCSQAGCAERVEGETARWCVNHKKCRVEGCGRGVEREGDDAEACVRHQPRRQYEYHPMRERYEREEEDGPRRWWRRGQPVYAPEPPPLPPPPRPPRWHHPWADPRWAAWPGGGDYY